MVMLDFVQQAMRNETRKLSYHKDDRAMCALWLAR